MTETIRLQARGQMVLPKSIRDRADAQEGALFAVATNGTSIVLHKITMPTENDLSRVLDEIGARMRKIPQAKKLKTPQDVVAMIHRGRSSTRTSSSRPRSGRKA